MRKVLYIFGQLSDRDIDWLAKTGKLRRLRAGEVLIEEGRPVDFVAILLDGRLRVTVDGVGQVAELGVGEVVGEMSFVDSAPPSATVTPICECLALAIDKQTLAAQMAADTGFGLRFYRALAIFLADRLRGTVRHLGYGETSFDSEAVLEDELDDNILDTVSLAGDRFDRMIKTLTGAGTA